MTDKLTTDYDRFVKSLELIEIDPFSISSRKIDAVQSDAPMNIQWHQALAEGDPKQLDDNIVFFRFRFEAIAAQEGKTFFQQVTEFALKFKSGDMSLFESTMKDMALKEHFLKNQITTTVWPIFRQHVLDGMSRVGLKSITLPWLFKKI